jgi:hypothetical protein
MEELNIEDERNRLIEEKQKLLNEHKTAQEIKKLKKELWYLKNPRYNSLSKTLLGIYNFLADIGDKVLKSITRVLSPRPDNLSSPNPQLRKKQKQTPPPTLDQVIKQFENL